MVNTLKDALGIGEDNDVYDSTRIALAERATSPFYGYFLISWLLINWQLVYAAFFIDQSILQDSLGLLRIEYLRELIPPSSGYVFWLHFFVFPFIVTIFAFWVFPYMTRVFYRKSINNQIQLKRIELQETSRATKEKTDLAKEETALIKQSVQKVRAEKKAKTDAPEVLWERDFQSFKTSPLYSKFDFIIRSIYERNGDIIVESAFTGPPLFQIPKDILAYAHTNDLVTMDKIKGKIELTAKGKFFVKKATS